MQLREPQVVMQPPRPVELIVKNLQSDQSHSGDEKTSDKKPLQQLSDLLDELVSLHLTLENDPAGGFLSNAEGNIRQYLYFHSSQS